MEKPIATPMDEDEMSVPEIMIREGKQLVKTTTFFQTAITVQKPRVLEDIREQLGKEADLAGEAFYYFWLVEDRRKKKKVPVEGPSIELAVSAARLWGNCVWMCDVDERDEMYVMMGHFVDLETGFNVARPFRQRKLPEIGEYEEERTRDQSFQIGVSKTMRNVIVRGGVPKWLINDAMARAKTATVTRYEKIWKDKKRREETIAKAVAELEEQGVPEAQIVKAMGPKRAWTPQTMAELRGMLQALKDGQSTVQEVFGGEPVSSEIEKQFWDRVNETPKVENGDVAKYLEAYSRTMNIPQVAVMKEALSEWDPFMESFKGWREKTQETPKKPAGRKKSEKGKGDTKGEKEKSPPGPNMESGAGEAQQKPDRTGPKGFDLLKKKMVGKIGSIDTEKMASSLLPEDLIPDQANQLLGFLETIDKIPVSRWIDELKSIGAWTE